MKVHQLTRGFWEHEPSLTLGCKRLRPLAPKLITSPTSGSHDSSSVITSNTTSSLDIKSFIRADSGPRRSPSSIDQEKRHSIQVEAQAGGTRWNPTQEQIGILEMLYKGGMRTPNAQQIEQITDQLSKYGKIEGKNVFYWFQNHKARERQKQKRSSLGLTPPPRTPAPPVNSINMDINGGVERSEEDNNYYYKRKYRSWGAGETGFQEGINMLNRSPSSTSSYSEEEEGDKTLELFPLHPESR